MGVHVVARSHTTETAEREQSGVSRTLFMETDVLEGTNLVGECQVYLDPVERAGIRTALNMSDYN